MYNREFEQMIKVKFKKYIITKDKQTELIQLSNKFTYKHLQTEIEKLKNEVNGDLIPKLMKEIIELRSIITHSTTPKN